jgi:hypothetical protein
MCVGAAWVHSGSACDIGYLGCKFEQVAHAEVRHVVVQTDLKAIRGLKVRTTLPVSDRLYHG